jgi:hypothetical protein
MLVNFAGENQGLAESERPAGYGWLGGSASHQGAGLSSNHGTID